MKGLLVFLFFCVALAAARPWDELREKYKTQIGESVYIDRQAAIIKLLYRVTQPNTFEDQVTIAKEYSIKENYAKYEPTEYAKYFFEYYYGKMLPKGRPYTVMYKALMNETVALYNLFYSAKDYETFYKTACWAREYINEEMFVYTFTTALIHRPDTKYYYIPPIYEIIPQYFFTDEVIDRAYKVQMQKSGHYLLPYVYPGEKDVVYVESNYSNWYYNYNYEQRLSYFTEDISWNAYYYNIHTKFPFWVSGEHYDEKKVGRGTIIYFFQQQILARYYAERLSNGLGEIPEFSWEEPIEVGYEPYLSYLNGIRYPARPNYVELKGNYLYVRELQDYEQRIRAAIDRGYAVKPDGTHVSLRGYHGLEILADMVESNYETPDFSYYGYPQYLARALLSYSPTPVYNHAVYPGALQLYQTSLRDPMFYQLLARYHRYFYHRYQSFLTPYTYEELSFPGVKVSSVDVSKLYTYMEKYDTEITNAVYQVPHEKPDTLVIKARQERLNHVPFTVTTTLESEKSTKVVLRYFFGPKYNGQHDALHLTENRFNFYLIDQHVYDLKSGKNVIERHSYEMLMGGRDWNSTRDIYEYGKYATTNKKPYSTEEITSWDSFPGRLLLPKSTRGGVPYYLYVIASPYEVPETVDDEYTHIYVDRRPLGYPFDRPLYEERFHLDNMYFKDVIVFHKTAAEVSKYH